MPFVQLTMLAAGLIRGQAPTRGELLGTLIALAGLLWLLLADLSAPQLGPVVLMAVAGIAWGGYTLVGRTQANPLTN